MIMQYNNKQMLFNLFLDKWQQQFEKAPYIINHVLSYPDVIARLKDFVPLDIEGLHEAQLEWISLLEQLENPIETEFFKDYWIPIQKDGYDFFIDISSDKFQIFKAHYFFFAPYRWYKEYIIDDVVDFLSSIDNKEFNLKEYLLHHENESWVKVKKLFQERKDMGFDKK
jgi:hypothetical protein